MRVQTEEEKKLIKKQFEEIFQFCPNCNKEAGREIVTKAFNLANEAHANMWRKSGEPYIFHPIGVARIVAEEIGLGSKAVASALLHDVVEDTDYTIDDIEKLFNPKIASIIDGLTKISEIFDEDSSLQAENFRKMLLTLAEDVRVILIKLADRLHNMRTLGSMPSHKQLKIASETLAMYAPLAHRLGLYAIKTELEDLSLKYKHPKIYQEIKVKLEQTEQERNEYIERFSIPVKKRLDNFNVKYSIKGRAKSIYSIWNKIQNKGISFEEIYDLFAIRVVFEAAPNLPEKNQCWDVYSIVTDIYQPNPNRLRDWVSTPKANGYEALHATVMGPEGKWVEVQIRSKRMDDIAERGYAAHWKYKDNQDDEGQLDIWLKKIREILDNPEADALEFLDNFKLNLFSSEIFIFTPKGQLRRLPQKSTALDFAYDIHSEVGNKAIGAKVNHKLVPLSHVLTSGDQVEVITSEKQHPQKEWLDYVYTAKAKSKINEAFKQDRKNALKQGRKLLEEKITEFKLQANADLYRKLFIAYDVFTKDELYRKIGTGVISLNSFEDVIKKKRKSKVIKYWNVSLFKPNRLFKGNKNKTDDSSGKKSKTILLKETETQNYIIAKCCNPIPGDTVMGFIEDDKTITIHKTTCLVARDLMANYGDRVLTAKWTAHKVQAFLARIKVNGIDKQGVVSDITNTISKVLDVNMRSIYFDSINGVFEGNIDLYVHSTDDIELLISKLKKISGVNSTQRIENIE